MAMNEVATALERAASVLRRRPSAGLHDDAPGMARWIGGVRTEATHANGQSVLTDMPAELGGAGAHASPGWLVRSGVAACTVTSIATLAAQEGIELQLLEVRVTSRSDTRGYLGLPEVDGAAISPGPVEMRMHVRLAAEGVSEERLRALVEAAQSRAPMTAVVQDPRPMETRVEIGLG